MTDDVLMVPLAAIALPVILVPTILSFRHAARKRDNQHRERMKALETGQPVPGEAAWPAAVACAAVGLGVPIGSFFLTWMACLTVPNLPAPVWIAPAAVSLVALMSAGQIAETLGRRSRTPSKPAIDAKPPMYDPDAYDVVGARG